MKQSPSELLAKIEEAKNMLRSDSTFIEMCKEFNVGVDVIDLVPIRFGDDLDVSAKTVRGIIVLNKKLLEENNFKNNIHYLLHEISHFLQMTTRSKPTQGADDGEYLENEDEIEAFKYQIEYMDDKYGDEEADKYLEHLLDHHNVNNEEERDEKKEELSERVEKIAQRTELDNLKPGAYGDGESTQLDLQKIDREWEAKKKVNENPPPYAYRPSWDTNFKKHEPWLSYEDTKKKKPPTHKEVEDKRPKINLDFQKLTPDQIKWRKLNDQETNKLLNDESLELSKARGPNEPPSTQVFFDLNKQLPEQAKATIISTYDEFRAIATVFKANYEEANEMASADNSLNYEGKYADCIKRLPDFIVRAARRGIGIFFGDTNGKSEDARELLTFLASGINIFNITPLNFQDKINQLTDASKRMSNINAAYSKRKTLLKKLPEKAQEAGIAYIRKKEVREFLKWLDEYFPNDKEEFFSDTVKEILEESRAGSEWTFNIGGLRKFKTFSSIYYQAQNSLRFNLINKMHENVRDELRQRLTSEVESRIEIKINELAKQAAAAKAENTTDLEKYLFATYKLDLRGILQISANVFRQRYQDDAWEKEFLDFKGNFVENLREKTKDPHETVGGPDGVNMQRKLPGLNASIDNQIIQVIKNFSEKHMAKGGKVDTKALSSLTGKDFDNLVFKSIYGLITKCLPNFTRDAGSAADNYKYPSMRGAGLLIRETGRLSPDNAINIALSKAPFVPKEFWNHLIKTAFKKFAAKPSANELITGHDDSNLSTNAILEEISHIENTDWQYALKLMLILLKKSGKYNPDSFTNLFVAHFRALKYSVSNLFGNLKQLKTEEEKLQVLNLAYKSIDAVDRDKDRLRDFSDHIHNTAKELSAKNLIKLMSNKNFLQYSSVGISKKVLHIAAVVQSYGGLPGLLKKYGPVIQSMRDSGYISQNFESNIRYVSKIINSDVAITPISPNFQKLFEAVATIETDLQAIEMADALVELTEDYKPKDKRLFDLNYNVTPDLRFRVLQDKDPRILRIGIETDCCQRIGGMGEEAAKQSFINPLAGIVILEWQHVGEWKILTQSYFHYVPKDNGFILDNVESNRRNVKTSDIDLETAYAMLGKELKEKFDIGYFLAGKSYSKINTKSFNTSKLSGGDPRYFDPKAGKYSDFSASNSINLLKPDFDLDDRASKLTGVKEKMTHAYVRMLGRIINTSLR